MARCNTLHLLAICFKNCIKCEWETRKVQNVISSLGGFVCLWEIGLPVPYRPASKYMSFSNNVELRRSNRRCVHDMMEIAEISKLLLGPACPCGNCQ